MTTAAVVVGEVEVLPPDVESRVVALQHLEGSERLAAVTVMLSHSRTGLLAAIAAQDLPQIVEWKAKGAAIQEITKQLRLGREMALDAAEFVRRAERGVGVAIRAGQAAGTVATPHEVTVQAAKAAKSPFSSRQNGDWKPPDTDFAERGELSGNSTKGQYGIYGMTDGVTDGDFEEALTEARSEENLSRANVSRKCKAKVAVDVTDPLIDAEVEPGADQPEEAAPQQKKRLTRHDSTEMLASINGMLNGIVESLPFIDPADIDAAENQAVIDNIRKSMGSIRKVLKEIVND